MSASTTAGMKLAGALPEVDMTTDGTPVAFERPRA